MTKQIKGPLEGNVLYFSFISILGDLFILIILKTSIHFISWMSIDDTHVHKNLKVGGVQKGSVG